MQSNSKTQMRWNLQPFTATLWRLFQCHKMFSAAEVLVRLRSGLRDQRAEPVQYPSLPLFIIILITIFIVMIIVKMTIIINDYHCHSYCHHHTCLDMVWGWRANSKARAVPTTHHNLYCQFHYYSRHNLYRHDYRYNDNHHQWLSSSSNLLRSGLRLVGK